MLEGYDFWVADQRKCIVQMYNLSVTNAEEAEAYCTELGGTINN